MSHKNVHTYTHKISCLAVKYELNKDGTNRHTEQEKVHRHLTRHKELQATQKCPEKEKQSSLGKSTTVYPKLSGKP